MSRFLRIPFAVALCLGVSLPAYADTDGMDVVVVTGTRLEQSVQDTSLAVSVLSEEALKRIAPQHISESLNRLPGVNLHRGNGAEHLTAIRSPVLTGGAGAGSFLYLEDGVPLRAAGFANVNGLFEAVDDLAGRIEVVRGPGGAVYGSNALHGLVNVITPDPNATNGLVSIEAGSYGRVRLNAKAAGQTALGAASIGISLRHEDGWRDDAGLDRLALQTRLDGSKGQTDWSLRLSAVNLEQETATFVRGFEAYESRSASRANTDPEAFRNAHALRASLHLDHQISETLSTRAVIYGRSNEMDFRLHFLPSEALEQTGHDSLGLQSALIWTRAQSTLQLGLDAEWTQGELYEFQSRPTLGSFVQGLHYDYEVEALTLAGFIQGDHQLTDRLRFEAGARLELTEYDYDNSAPDGAVGRYLRLPDRSDDFTTFAPNVGLVFEASDSVSLFVRAARGVRAPQTAELYRLQPGQDIDQIDPETLDSLEAGTRLRLGSGASLDVTGFVMEKSNVFFRDANGVNVTDGETRHHGIELEGRYPLTSRLRLEGAVSWAIHEYAFDRPARNASEAIVDGARIDTAPEWLSNVRLIWLPTEALELEAEWAHTSEYYANAANTAEYDGHDLINVRGSYRLAENLSLYGAVRNIFDERYAERADFAFGSYRYFPGEPISVHVGIRISNN